MAEILELQKRINKFIDLKYELDEKIEVKLEAVDQDESKLGTHKASVTRWRNNITRLDADIVKYEDEIKALRATKTETSESIVHVQSGGGASTFSKELKTLQHDFSTHPRFSQKLDVAVFTRHMQVLYDTHVAVCTGLEQDFVKLVECHIDTSYRVQLQRYVEANSRFATWSELKKYLVETHRSCTTLFQEMAKFSSLPMRSNETVREYCNRVETAADEAQTIIMSKLKEQTNIEPTAQDIFELMKMDAVVRQMQAHHKYREDFNIIVNTIDDCVNLDMLSQKASKVADRKVNTDDMFEPGTYLAGKSETKSTPDKLSAMEKQISKMMALMAQGQNQKSQPPEKKVSKEKSDKEWRNRCWDDPEYRKKHANSPCHAYEKNNSCSRSNCPFSPCNKKSSSKSFYSTDF